MVGIYKITNLINGKVYIGQSINIQKRLNEHKYKAFNEGDNSYNCAIHNAFRKYGIENFEFEILEETKQECLDEREIFYIEKYNSLSPNGYNIRFGGQRSINKRSKKKKKKYFCKECGKEVSKSKSGLCISCFNKSRSTKNKPDKEELRNLIMSLPFTKIAKIYGVSDNAIRKWCKSYNLPYKKKDLFPKEKQETIKEIVDSRRAVEKIDINTGEVIDVYSSCSEAARSVGAKSNSHIVEACNGKLKRAHGYMWRYI